MATCRNHAEREAPNVCSGCGGSFCDSCVVRFEKLLFCEACKARYLEGIDDAPRVARKPGEAARPARREPARRGGRPLDWLLGAAALAFTAVFLVVIIAALADPVRALFEDRKLAKAFDGLVTIGAAIERYRADKGDWPQSLDALVPTYLTEIPRDPYAGTPPRFETSPSLRVWSIGPDGEDDGGDVEQDLVYAVEPVGT